MTKATDRLIVALDVATKEEALSLVGQLRGQISFFKIGLQLYTAEGPAVVRAISAAGAKVFLAEFGDKIKIVVPGIRPSWSEPGDQKRIMTPREAIDAGADYLVIGRPITAHKDPREAVAKILGELEP